MRHKSFIFAVMLLIGALVLAGCSGGGSSNDGDDITNKAPVISSSSYMPEDIDLTKVSKGQEITFSVTATDSDKDKLTYSWADGGVDGFNTKQGKSVTWTAPDKAGKYTVAVSVSDQKTTTSKKWDITVIDNSVPTISSSTPSSASVEMDISATQDFSVTATDPDGDTLSYTWEKTGNGTWDTTPTTSDDTVTWKAPATDANATVKVTVTDDKGGSASFTWNITIGSGSSINNDPEIDSKTPSNDVVALETGGSKKFIVSASDDDGDQLSYAWNNTGNGTINETSNAYEINYKAADQAEQDKLTVTVTDGKGGSVSFTWTINVAEQNIVNINITNDNYNIDTATIWKSGTIYRIEAGVLVSETLTIQPGAIIKFAKAYGSSTGLSLYGNGRIVANGTADKPIIFTSDLDNTHGGDTSGSSSSQPAAGDWEGLNLGSSNSQFTYCEFYYGGDEADLITVGSSSSIVTIENCTFAHNNNTDDYYVLNLENATADSVIDSNLFYDNRKVIYMDPNISLDDSNLFEKDGEKNKFSSIFINNNDSITGNVSWSETEIAYVLTEETGLAIDTGGKLSLVEDVVVKLQAGGNCDIRDTGSGILQADGAVFTAYSDDNYGGDSDGNGVTGTPARGTWGDMTLGNDSSSLKNCQILYGGGEFAAGMVCIDENAAPIIDSNIIAHSEDYGLYVPWYAGDGAGENITNNSFFDNEKPLFLDADFSIDDSNEFSVTGKTPNDYNGIFTGGGISEGEHVTWEETEVPFVVEDEDIYVQQGGSLSLASDVVLKFAEDMELRYQGNNLLGTDGTQIDGSSDIIFTSYYDDQVKGDTANSPLSPTIGDWVGIYNDDIGDYETWGNIFYDEYAQNTH